MEANSKANEKVYDAVKRLTFTPSEDPTKLDPRGFGRLEAKVRMAARKRADINVEHWHHINDRIRVRVNVWGFRVYSIEALLYVDNQQVVEDAVYAKSIIHEGV